MQITDHVIYKNNQIIAFNKPGNLSVQEDKTEDKSLNQLAEIYTKGKIFVVHRIDRPASGVVLFAKTIGAVQDLNEQFRERKTKKTYLAVVKNKPKEDAGTLVHHLLKNQKSNKTKAYKEAQEHTKRAELNYKVIGKSDNYSLLEIELITGRHHQIRAQLGAIGSPIKGDVKYGARRGNKDRSIHLHAWKMTFTHPVTGVQENVVAPLPKEDAIWQFFAEKKTEIENPE